MPVRSSRAPKPSASKKGPAPKAPSTSKPNRRRASSSTDADEEADQVLEDVLAANALLYRLSLAEGNPPPSLGSPKSTASHGSKRTHVEGEEAAEQGQGVAPRLKARRVRELL